MKSSKQCFVFSILLLISLLNCIIITALANIPTSRSIVNQTDYKEYESQFSAEYKLSREPFGIFKTQNKRNDVNIISSRLISQSRNNYVLYNTLEIPTKNLDYYIFCLNAYGVVYNVDDLTTTSQYTLLYLKTYYTSALAEFIYHVCVLCNLLIPLMCIDKFNAITLNTHAV